METSFKKKGNPATKRKGHNAHNTKTVEVFYTTIFKTQRVLLDELQAELSHKLGKHIDMAVLSRAAINMLLRHYGKIK